MIFGGLDERVDERELLADWAVQISDAADHSVGMCGGRARQELALPFGGDGLIHDDADAFRSIDEATPPECSMIWRPACPS